MTPHPLTLPQGMRYDAGVSTSKVEAGGESPNGAAKAATPATVSAAFSRLSPIHPHGFDDHADSLAARAEGAARLAGAPSVSQPPFRAATTFESVAAVSKTATGARAMTQHQLVTVDFHGQSILAATIDGKPYVAMKPIVENIGLQWEAQQKRIQRNPVLKAAMSMMDIPSAGGVQQTTCLPLSMLNGWLFGVDVNRVREEIRPKLIRYQTECFEVLAQHFMPAQRPHNPALDYDRISPAQAQDLKELVHAIAESKVQGFGETWARLHRKFRVNSYLELPATKFDEARDYLLGKLPETPAPALPDAQRLQLAFSVAAEAGAQVQRSVFEQLTNGAQPDMVHARTIAAVSFDRNGKPTVPWAQAMGAQEFITTADDFPHMLTRRDVRLTDVQASHIISACAQLLTERAALRMA